MHYSIFKQELGQMNINVKSRIFNAFVVGFLSFFISASWALSSPPGSSPDEDAHLTTAWCESKYGSNDCAEVPLKVVESGKCFFLDADSVPTCANEIENKQVPPERLMIKNLYYKVLSVFVDQNDINISVVKMRLFNCLIMSIVLAIVYLYSTKHIANATVLGWMIVNIPLGFFIVSSINSSSWLFIFTTLLFPLLYQLFNDKSRLIKPILVIAIISILFYAIKDVRKDTSLFVLIYIVAILPHLFSKSLINELRKIKYVNYRIILVIVSSLSSIFLLFEIWKRSKQIDFRETDVSLWENVARLPSIVTGVLGSWGIGSLEVRMPGSTHVVAFMVFVSILFIAIRFANYMELQSIFTYITFIFLIPLFVLTRSNLRVGEWVQPRYILPIFYGLIMLAILIILNNSNLVNKYSLIIMGVLTNIAYSFAIYTTLRRYTVGLSQFDFNLASDNSWWWDFGLIPPPFIIFLISILSYLMLSVFMAILINKELIKKTADFSKKTS
jgi:hypothetical protein